MDRRRYRAYRVTGNLCRYDRNLDPVSSYEEYVLLWVMNWPLHGQDYSFKMDFGSYDNEGGIINFGGCAQGRYELAEALSNTNPRTFSGHGSLATATAPRSDDDLDRQVVTLRFFETDAKTRVKLNLAPYAADAGGVIELTDAQRRDLQSFLEAGNPVMGDYDTTELVSPDGTVQVVDTYCLQRNSSAFPMVNAD